MSKHWYSILFLFLSFTGFAQRPDLSIGATGNIRYLQSIDEQVKLISPDVTIHLQVSKRSKLIGLITGFWTTLDLQADNLHGGFHHYHIDAYAGMMIVRKPAFKLSFYPIISNSISLNKNDKLDQQTTFSRYQLYAIPELNCTYKNLIFAVNFNIAITGSKLIGPGFKFGIAI